MTFNIGIIGYGQFGRFMEPYARRFADVSVYDPKLEGSSLETLADSDLVIFAVPVQELKGAATAASAHIQPTALVADVSSVKVKPLQILAEVLPQNPLLGTHPIFGPQSGKAGVEGLPIVLTNVSWPEDAYARALHVLSTDLALKVLELSADEHDREMARIQGLAHFIGRALGMVDVKDYPTATKSYRHLIELRDLLKDDSWELFTTIQSENPYAAEVRREFLAALQELEERLGN